MRVVIQVECPDGKPGELIKVSDEKGRAMIASGAARLATLAEQVHRPAGVKHAVHLKGGVDG
jgi:hypothetical protein